MTIENSSPEQLSMPVTPLGQKDQTLQKLAMKSYLEARQRADLRRDLAARRLPTEGLVCFSTRRSCLLLADCKKQDKHGTTSGRWYKARILSQEGAICVIDAGSTALRINQSKLRKDKIPGDTTESQDSDLSAPPTFFSAA